MTASLTVGVPTEIKDNENRVAMQPDGVAELTRDGHSVLIQTGAGQGSRFSDGEFAEAGATIVADADAVFGAADLIVKVKEPIPSEYHRFREGQQLFTYLHLAADRELTEFLIHRNIDSIAYETVQTPDLRLPLLTPMSEVAGWQSKPPRTISRALPEAQVCCWGVYQEHLPPGSPSSVVVWPAPRQRRSR